MTAPVQSLLQPLKDRLAAATPGPWEVADDPLSDGDWMVRQIDYEPDTPDVVAAAIGHESTAELIASAPTDQAKLIAAIEAAEKLAADWTQRGEHDMAYSKTINDPDIAMALLTEGASMVENARLIRVALTQALGGDTA